MFIDDILHPRRIAHHHICSPGAKATMRVHRLHPLRQRSSFGLILG